MRLERDALEPRPYNECELNGVRIHYDVCHGGTLEEAKKIYGETHKYLGSGFITYHNGVRNKNREKEHFFKSSFKNPTEIYLENRIEQLNKADADYCKDRWDKSKSEMERKIAREFSNQVTYARQELQAALKHLKGLEKGCGYSDNPPVEQTKYKIILPTAECEKAWTSDIYRIKKYAETLKITDPDLYGKANIFIQTGQGPTKSFTLSEWLATMS